MGGVLCSMFEMRESTKWALVVTALMAMPQQSDSFVLPGHMSQISAGIALESAKARVSMPAGYVGGTSLLGRDEGKKGVTGLQGVASAQHGGSKEMRRRTVTVERLKGESGKAVLPLRIDGEWYDLSDYRETHPGGKWLLDYAYGKDVTAIFKSIHMFGEADTKSVLKKLPIIDMEAEMLHNPHVFSAEFVPTTTGQEIETPFRQELAEMLHRRFATRADFKAPFERKKRA